MTRVGSGPARFVFAVGLMASPWRLCAADEEPPVLRLPADRTYDGAAGSPGAVRFRHETHVSFADGRCIACHPAPFRMLRAGGSLTHRKMNAGRQCGICHDGKRASSVREDCGHCHGTGEGS